MTIAQLIGRLPASTRVIGDPAREIAGLSTDSRRVMPGALFIAVPGEHTDGHAFVDAAIKNGATAVVVEEAHALNVPDNVTAVAVPDTRRALSVLADSLPALLAAMFVLGVGNRLTQVSATLAGTRGPVAARSEGTASALLTATRQCGSAIGVAILSATLVAVHGGTAHRTEVAMFVAAGFAVLGLLATRIVPAAEPASPGSPAGQRHHLFFRHAGGLP